MKIDKNTPILKAALFVWATITAIGNSVAKCIAYTRAETINANVEINSNEEFSVSAVIRFFSGGDTSLKELQTLYVLLLVFAVASLYLQNRKLVSSANEREKARSPIAEQVNEIDDDRLSTERE